MFTLEYKDNVNIISINTSHANSENADQFNSFLLKQKYQGLNILFDLTRCEYINSTFLGVVVSNFLRLKEKNFITKIVSSEKVAFIMDEVSHLSSIIELFQDKEKAMQSFS
jgi:anti-anti-sigma regulatory factor